MARLEDFIEKEGALTPGEERLLAVAGFSGLIRTDSKT